MELVNSLTPEDSDKPICGAGKFEQIPTHAIKASTNINKKLADVLIKKPLYLCCDSRSDVCKFYKLEGEIRLCTYINNSKNLKTE